MNQLKRTLTLTDLTLIAIGSTIGSGIFKTPSSIAQLLPDPFWIMLIWAVGGVIALTGALTFSELSSTYSGSGGIYVFLREGYGKGIAFLYGWCILTVINTGSMAALATVFSDYLSELILISPLQTDIGVKGRLGIAIGGIAFLTWVSLKGAASGSRFSGLFTFMKVAGVAAIIIIGFGMGLEAFPDLSIGLPDQPMQKGLAACLGLAMVKVLWSYGGWQHASYIAGEAKSPEKTVPRAMIIGALIVTLAYMLANLAYMKLLPLSEIQGNPVVASAALKTIFGIKGGIVISILIFISTFGTAGIYTLTAPRIYFAMAEDGLFFKKFAEVDPKTGTPVFAVIFQSCWAVLLILAWGTFEHLIDYVVFVEWIFLSLAAASLFILRKKRLTAQNSFKVPLYPITPIIFIVVSSLVVINTFIYEPVNTMAGLFLMGIGAIVGGIFFGIWKKSEK